MDNPNETPGGRALLAAGNALGAGADIPGVVAAAFMELAAAHRERATWLADNRKKGWKSTGEMLTFAAEQLESAAGELENGPPAAVPAPTDAPPCASFRRATDDDPVICTLPRGHSGDHGAVVLVGPGAWPRRHSGELCNVAMTQENALGLQCSLPLGHADGHQADDPSGVTWLWTYGTEPVQLPADDPDTAEDDAAVSATLAEIEQLHPNQCTSVARGERCALTAEPPHSGNHIGTKGGRWPQDYLAPGEKPPAASFEAKEIEYHDASGAVVAVETTAAIPAQRTEEPDSMDAPNPFGPVQPAPSSAALVPFRAPSIVVPLLPKAPVAEREYDSVSSIESMAGCGMKYRLHYHENAPELPAWWLVGGKAFHRVVEEVERNAAKGITTTTAQAEGAWAEAFAAEIEQTEAATGVPRKHWRAAKGTKASGPENEAWWAENGKAMSVRYLVGRRALVEDGWELLRNGAGDLALELEFRFPLGFVGRPIRGFIDSVWINRAKQMVLVVDDKSGARPAESTFQLETYAAAVATLLAGSDMADWPVLGTYYNARKGEYSARIQIDTAAAAAIADARSAMTWQAERAGVFLPRVTNMCKGCGVAASCPVMSLKASTPLEAAAAGTNVEAPEW